MKISKILSIMLCLLLASSFVFAQGRTETTVEEEYLSTVEDIIIQELTAAPDRDSKLVALQYLESAIAGGRASPDMAAALDSLAGEGIYNESRTDGRLANNYPDIRTKACDLLGEIKTEESKNSLVKPLSLRFFFKSFLSLQFSTLKSLICFRNLKFSRSLLL